MKQQHHFLLQISSQNNPLRHTTQNQKNQKKSQLYSEKISNHTCHRNQKHEQNNKAS